MAGTATIMIDVDDSGAISSFRQMSSEGAKIGPSLSAAAPALDKVNSSTKQARESAALLGEQLGVNIPRGLRSILAENSAIAPALQAAFSGAVVAGFIGIVKEAVDQLTGFSAGLDAIKKQSEALLDSVGQANKTLIDPKTLGQVNAQILGTTKQIEDLNQQLGLTGDSLGDALTRGLTKYSAANSILLEQLDSAKASLNEEYALQAKLTAEQTLTEPLELLKTQNAAREAGLVGIEAITTAANDQIAVVRKQIAITNALSAALTAQTGIPINNAKANALAYSQIDAIKAKEKADSTKYLQEEGDATRQMVNAAVNSALEGQALLDAQRQEDVQQNKTALDRKLIDVDNYIERNVAINEKYYNDSKKLAIQQANDILNAQEAAAVAMVPPWERSYAQIEVDYEQQMRKIEQELKQGVIDQWQAADLTAAAWQMSFAKTRDQLASDMEGFFDDLTSGNIGQRFKKMFEDLVFQMVATWIVGMNQMKSASQVSMGGGGGGILGTIFGGIFGGGGGPGGTPPFLGGLFGGAGGGVPNVGIDDLVGLGALSGLPTFGASQSGDSGGALSTITGIGLSAGQGVGLGGIVLPSGSATGSAGGPAAGIVGLLAKIFPNGLSIGGLNIPGSLLATGGLALAINGIQRGGVLGALEGAGGGALAGFSIGGPIGAAIGAVVGALASIIKGLFGPHTGDTARIQVMEPLLASIKTITDSYDVFQTDYNTGVSELEALRTNALAALKKIGGKQVSGNSAATNQRVDAAEQHLKDTEAERQRRSQIDFGAPQFHEGGFVHSGLSGFAPSSFRAGALTFHSGGDVPAVLQSGEFVFQRSAVNRLGLSNLQRMNSGAGGGDTVHLSVNTIDAKSFEKFLDGGGMKSIFKSWQRASRSGVRI
jgi:gas vesicle protein